MWKIVTNDHFMNQQLIFPAAQPSVACIVRNAQKYDAVNKIVVFGSSITSAFSPVSDIDIMVEQADQKRYLLAKGCQRGVDYWRREDCDAALLQEVEKNGVVVFERTGNSNFAAMLYE